ncbi:MAG TPA: KH domain-containing protein, partial [Burkholderiales bacterium]|nr:KH domain-containing protein [Burkholderiales bacterium]
RCEVVIDAFRLDAALRRIEATILVERESQKGIVVGRGGDTLKRVARDARRDMEQLFGGKVFLNVWVKVRDKWTDDLRILHQLGYA